MKKYLTWILTGVLTVLLGLFILTNTSKAIVIMVLGFGLYTLFNGILSFIYSFKLRYISPLAFTLNIIKATLDSAVGLLASMMALSNSGQELGEFIVYIIAFTLLVSAISDILGSIILYSNSADITFAGPGIISLILSFVMFLFPKFVSSSFVSMIGLCIVFIGLVNIVWGIRTFKLVRAYNQTSKSQNVAEAEFSEK
ncbi:MAG: DUF308 domain-containing protein [Sphaerochaetaceae bacterium]|nr:DUF308 domain-containing protein [Sphaerochaetaceae bacterium]